MRVLAWRGDATTTSRRVAYVCAVGVHARASCADAPALALVSTQRCARLRVSARWHACIPTCSHTDAKLAKRGCSQQTEDALSEYEGRVRNRYRFLTPKMGSSFFKKIHFGFGRSSCGRSSCGRSSCGRSSRGRSSCGRSSFGNFLSAFNAFMRIFSQFLAVWRLFSFNVAMFRGKFLSASGCLGLVFFKF